MVNRPPKDRLKNRKMVYGDAPYSMDAVLIGRVKKYLDDAGGVKFVELDQLSSFLQVTYVEYRRKKKFPFRILVQKAYEHVATEMRNDYASSSSSDASDIIEDRTGKVERRSINDSLTELYSRIPTTGPASVKDPIATVHGPQTLKKNADPTCTPAAESVPSCNGDGEEVVGSDSSRRPDRKSLSRSASKRKEIDAEPEFFKRRKSFVAETSTMTFDDFGGNDEALLAVYDVLEDFVDARASTNSACIRSRGVLLHGPPGCGKSLLAEAIAGEIQLPLISVASTELVSGVSGDSEQRIRDLFSRARTTAPCLLFIDEVDSLTSKRENAHKDMERRIVSQLLKCFDQLAASGAPVLVVGATNFPDQIDVALRRAKRFDEEVALGIPNLTGRQQILQILCRSLQVADDVNFRQLSLLTPGFVGSDLFALVAEATRLAKRRVRSSGALVDPCANVIMESAPSTPVTMDTEEAVSVIRDPILRARRAALKLRLQNIESDVQDPQVIEVSTEDFQMALKKVQPSSLREGFLTIPDVTWEDVGALSDVREELKFKILDRVADPDYYESLGLTTPSGVLICGPPGCGKTLLAKAVANEAGINFLSVKGPEIFNMYVGESERAIRQVFARAKNSSPCVVFFDEIDSVCQKRSGSSESGSGTRVVNQLLTEMDGMSSRKGVYLMAATNRPEIIDPAVLRPGRIDKLLYVGLPGPADRADILRAVTRDGRRPRLSADVDLKALAADDRCDGLTGADLASLVREAAELTARERLPEVMPRHFQRALERIQPSVRPADRPFYERIRLMCSNWKQ